MAGTLERLIKFLRYRFMLFAGLLPYGLGSAIALYQHGQFSPPLFLIALCGLFFVLVGVEALNEYFDWQGGTDRVFQLEPKPVTARTFRLALGFFFIAFIIAIYLTLKIGLLIIIISILGFIFALFYLAPPLKFAYRGLGEIVISLSYGPLMILGSYYVQTQRVDWTPLFISMIPAALLFIIAILNEVPDYLQDHLVGKRNICVRIGRQKVIRLAGVIMLLFNVGVIIALYSGKLPSLAWLVVACLPLFLMSYNLGLRVYDNPQQFVPAIRYMIIYYVIVLSILITVYILASSHQPISN